jgi:hypothetical protein
VLPVERFLVRSDHHSPVVGLAAIAAECLLFAVVYLGVLRVASPSRFRSVRGLAERAVNKLYRPSVSKD